MLRKLIASTTLILAVAGTTPASAELSFFPEENLRSLYISSSIVDTLQTSEIHSLPPNVYEINPTLPSRPTPERAIIQLLATTVFTDIYIQNLRSKNLRLFLYSFGTLLESYLIYHLNPPLDMSRNINFQLVWTIRF